VEADLEEEDYGAKLREDVEHILGAEDVRRLGRKGKRQA
jgi:hypothetical protein